MKVLIIGAGDVGCSLARRLSTENHDVTIIEHNSEKLERLNEQLDVMVLRGNGASARLLEEADITKTNMIIAVTNSDEVNMISCLLAREFKVPVKIARISNPDYSTDIPQFIKQKMGIDLIINPNLQVADEISRLLQNPEASDTARFAGGRIQLIDLVLTETDKIIHIKLKEFFELRKLYSFLIVAILRKQQLIIPSGEDELRPQDHIYIIAEAQFMSQILDLLGKKTSTIESLTIIGGGKIGGHIARLLENQIPRIKIIERNPERCEELNSILEKSLILQADATDLESLLDEDIDKTDALVTATANDKTNVLMSLLGRHMNIRKIISIINDERYFSMLSSLGIDTVINPKRITADNIIKYLRRGQILSISTIGSEDAEILEFEAKPEAQIVGHPLAKVKVPQGCIIGAILHKDLVIIPGGHDVIRAGDRVIIFSLRSKLKKVEEMFLT